jgi:hypothetical protein
MFRFVRYAFVLSLLAASSQAITIHVDGSTYACSDVGITQAINDLPGGHSGVVIVDGCSGNVPISRTVSIPQGVDLVLQPAFYQAHACPAFSIDGEAGVLEGTGQGNPQADTSTGHPTIIQAATGCTGSIVRININAGSKGGTIRNLRIAGNSTATAGIEIGPIPQIERNIVRDVSIGGLLTGSSCLLVDGGPTQGAAGLLVDNLSAQLCATGLNLAGDNLNGITIQNSRITCSQQAVPCYVVGSDLPDQPGQHHGSEDISFINDDIETVGSAPTMVGKLQNVVAFKLIGGRHEAGGTMHGPNGAMLVIGDLSVSANNPSIIGTFFQGNALANYGIEFASTFWPNVNGVFFFQMNTSGIRNTSKNTGGTVLASRPDSSSSPIDDVTGISMVNNQANIANSYPIFGQGVLVAGQGVVIAAGVAPTTTSGQVGFGSTTANTAMPGASGVLPDQVAGYLIVNIGGQNYKIPFFNP